MNRSTNDTATCMVLSVATASEREHLLTVMFGLWMTIGLFTDGYFHQNLDSSSESFITPWHGVFYSGFAASALWLGLMSRRRAPGALEFRVSHLPTGYGPARTGLVLFAFGGAGDAAWHAAVGVERGVDALLSPTHLLLFVGLTLILTTPWRAALAGPDSAPSPWIVVGSIASATALTAFFVNFVWGLGIAGLAQVPYDSVTEAGETAVIAGVASMLVTTAVLFGAARVLLDRGVLPACALTVTFGAVAGLVSAAFDEDIEGVLAAIIAGAAIDVLLRVRLSPRNQRHAIPLAFGVAAALLWLSYFGLLSGLNGIAWHAEIWLGAVVLNVLAALTIAAVPRAPTPLGK